MNVGIVGPITFVHRLDDGQRFLRTGTAIQIYQRLAVHLLVKNWKVLSNGINIYHRFIQSELISTRRPVPIVSVGDVLTASSQARDPPRVANPLHHYFVPGTSRE